jgi:hypothetical protein
MILNPLLIPTAGIPQPVMAPARRRRVNPTMAQPGFYQQQLQPQQQALTDIQQNTQQQEPQFQQPAITGDYIASQLQKLQARAAPPSLEPGARVRAPNSELVSPSSFQQFYERLGLIDSLGQEMEGTAKARSAYKRQQELNSILQKQVSGFNLPTLQGGSSGNSGGGQAFGSGVPSNPQANFRFAQNIAPNFGWSGNELSAWYTLGMKESGWRNTAQNPTSTAYGIGQFLNSTWKGVGIAKTSDPATQVEAMARYIKNRYGSPSRALAFHLKNNWY